VRVPQIRSSARLRPAHVGDTVAFGRRVGWGPRKYERLLQGLLSAQTSEFFIGVGTGPWMVDAYVIQSFSAPIASGLLFGIRSCPFLSTATLSFNAGRNLYTVVLDDATSYVPIDLFVPDVGQRLAAQVVNNSGAAATFEVQVYYRDVLARESIADPLGSRLLPG
jgi:hypothetical protein